MIMNIQTMTRDEYINHVLVEQQVQKHIGEYEKSLNENDKNEKKALKSIAYIAASAGFKQLTYQKREYLLAVLTNQTEYGRVARSLILSSDKANAFRNADKNAEKQQQILEEFVDSNTWFYSCFKSRFKDLIDAAQLNPMSDPISPNLVNAIGLSNINDFKRIDALLTNNTDALSQSLQQRWNNIRKEDGMPRLIPVASNDDFSERQKPWNEGDQIDFRVLLLLYFNALKEGGREGALFNGLKAIFVDRFKMIDALMNTQTSSVDCYANTKDTVQTNHKQCLDVFASPYAQAFQLGALRSQTTQLKPIYGQLNSAQSAIIERFYHEFTTEDGDFKPFSGTLIEGTDTTAYTAEIAGMFKTLSNNNVFLLLPDHVKIAVLRAMVDPELSKIQRSVLYEMVTKKGFCMLDNLRSNNSNQGLPGSIVTSRRLQAVLSVIHTPDNDNYHTRLLNFLRSPLYVSLDEHPVLSNSLHNDLSIDKDDTNIGQSLRDQIFDSLSNHTQFLVFKRFNLTAEGRSSTQADAQLLAVLMSGQLESILKSRLSQAQEKDGIHLYLDIRQSDDDDNNLRKNFVEIFQSYLYLVTAAKKDKNARQQLEEFKQLFPYQALLMKETSQFLELVKTRRTIMFNVKEQILQPMLETARKGDINDIYNQQEQIISTYHQTIVEFVDYLISIVRLQGDERLAAMALVRSQLNEEFLGESTSEDDSGALKRQLRCLLLEKAKRMFGSRLDNEVKADAFMKTIYQHVFD